MGARVIKIERPGAGDFARGYDERVRGLSSHFVWTNRSKESLTLDLKRDEAGDIMDRLLQQADVLVQNLAPGAAARLGLSFEALHARYPRLIVCDISGYGEGGPYQDKKAYDLLIQSESGFLSVTGTADDPVKAGCSIADISAGMYAYSAILNRAAAAPENGPGQPAGCLHAGKHGRVDGLSDVLRVRRRDAARARRRGPCVHLPLRPVSHRRRQHHHAGPAERTRMARVLRPVLRQAELAEARALPRIRCAPPTATPCGG